MFYFLKQQAMYRRVLNNLKPSQRNYVGLAFSKQHKKDSIETIDRSLKPFQHIVKGATSTISEVGTGNKIITIIEIFHLCLYVDITMENEREPIFEVVNSGVGELLV